MSDVAQIVLHVGGWLMQQADHFDVLKVQSLSEPRQPVAPRCVLRAAPNRKLQPVDSGMIHQFDQFGKREGIFAIGKRPAEFAALGILVVANHRQRQFTLVDHARPAWHQHANAIVADVSNRRAPGGGSLRLGQLAGGVGFLVGAAVGFGDFQILVFTRDHFAADIRKLERDAQNSRWQIQQPCT